MEELTIEEKAKAYNEAKARMSRAFNSNRCTIGFMNEIFPELKESEDKEIREQIVYAINKLNVPGSEKNKLLAWLEEQGGQKPTDKDMVEALRTEYEKGRADVIADTISWLENCWPRYCSNQTIIKGFKEAIKGE